MANEYFHFKQFSIFQDRCAMKVGTDGVLLGAWVGIMNARKILDIGTGTGLIALMLAQRSTASITAIEIEKEAANQAMENIHISPWKDRIAVHNVSLQEYTSQDSGYDLIVTNPPYFSDFQFSSGSKRELARQSHALSLEELIDGVFRLMSKTGRFALIYPAESFNELIEMAGKRNISPHRITRVIPKPGSKAKRVLAEFSLGKNDIVNDELIIEENGRHQYSEEYKNYTAEFYLA